MTIKTFYLESKSNHPYENLALEEYLLGEIPEDGYLLYLWQNDKTVVIGQNQNPYAQCNLTETENHGITIARRLSGGGTVYQDMGNLNFTFIAGKQWFSSDRNYQILTAALRKLGITAEKSGRNDLEIAGRKISGNAFYVTDTNSYHHGTLLVDCDLDQMGRVLKVRDEKWRDKGIVSVRSRVANLSDFLPGITTEMVKDSLKQCFAEEFHQEPVHWSIPETSQNKTRLLNKYSSWKWNMGKEIPAAWSAYERFDWGEVTIELNIQGDEIEQAAFYTDALEIQLFRNLSCSLSGCRFSMKEIENRLTRIGEENSGQALVQDMISLLKRSMGR